MKYNLWIDDQAYDPETPERHAPEGWLVATSNAEAMKIVEENGLPNLIDFDHDLGMKLNHPDEVTTFIKWMIEKHLDCKVPDYRIHSANPAGRENIKSLMDSWRKVSGAYE